MDVKRLLDIYKDVYVLGLSATHIRYLDNGRDMAEELFNSNIASHINLGEAIATGILKTPKYVISMYSYEEELYKYHKWIDSIKNKGRKASAQKYIDKLKRNLDASAGLNQVFNKHMRKKTGKYVAFCADTNHMERIIAAMDEWLSDIDSNPRIYKVHSKQDSKKIFREIEKFSNDNSRHIKIMFCIDMLNEGIHINSVDGVILFRPTISPIVYKQQIGRALSVGSKGVPIIFDIVNNFENIDSIASVKEEMKIATEKYKQKEMEDKIIVHDFEIYDETKSSRKLFKELEKLLGTSWGGYYEAAKEYYEHYYNLLVPHNYKTSEGLSLGKWIKDQRRLKTEYSYVSLAEAQRRIELLDKIGMIWNANESKWEIHLNALRNYYEEHGHINVPRRYVTESGLNLGIWIAYCKGVKKGKINGCLDDKRIADLEALGMVWDDVSECEWRNKYRLAVQYYEENGNLNVPYMYETEENVKLGLWISKQRKQYQKGVLAEDRVMALNNIGMRWIGSVEARWNSMFDLAKAYYIEHGDLEVPFYYKTGDGKALGRWVRYQKYKKEQNQLSEERIKLLEQLEIAWIN